MTSLWLKISRLLFFLFFLIPLFSRVSTAETPKQDDSFYLVKSAVDNQDEITFEGIKVLSHWWDRETSIQALHVFKDHADQRYDYFPRTGHNFQEMILTENHAIYANPSRHLAYRSPSAETNDKSDLILTLAAQNYSWIDEGEDEIAFHLTHRIAAVSVHESKTIARFWVDAVHNCILGEARYEDGKSPVFFSGYLTADFPKDLPDRLFKIHDPIALRNLSFPKELQGKNALNALDFQPLFPQFVPAGFMRVGTYLTEWGSRRKLQFRYSDGLRNFSIYENARKGMYHPVRGSTVVHSSDGRSYEFVESEQGKLVRFGQGNLTVAVVGNLPLAMIQNIAESIGTGGPTTPIRRLPHYFHRGLSILRRIFKI